MGTNRKTDARFLHALYLRIECCNYIVLNDLIYKSVMLLPLHCAYNGAVNTLEWYYLVLTKFKPIRTNLDGLIEDGIGIKSFLL